MHRSLRLAAGVLVLAAMVGCSNETGSSGGEILDHRPEVPTPPSIDEGIQFVQPETIIPPGGEVMTCWVPEWVPERDYFVSRFEGFQGTGGHHVVALTSAVPYEPGEVFDCTNIESLAGFRPLILPDPETGPLLPEDFYVRLPAGSLIVVQSHYINYTDEPIRVADVARFDFVEPDGRTEAGYLIVNHGNFSLPARGPGSAHVSCSPGFEDPVNLLVLFGHMHEMGTDISIRRERDGAMEELYRIDPWVPDFRDEPPVEQYGAGEAELLPDDRLLLDCNFDNPLDRQINFPREMCTGVAYYYPALPGEGRVITCDD